MSQFGKLSDNNTMLTKCLFLLFSFFFYGKDIFKIRQDIRFSRLIRSHWLQVDFTSEDC